MPRRTPASSTLRPRPGQLVLLCALLALPAAARKPGDLDALAASRRLDVTLKARVQASGLVRPGAEPQVHERLGVPTFLWASSTGSEAGLAALRAARGAASLKPGAAPALPEEAARAHLATYASLYGLGPADLATVEVSHVHDLGRGAVVVQLQQRLDGLEVFREQLRVVMGRDQSLVALSGFLAPGSAAAAAVSRAPAVPPTQAVALAFSDLCGQPVGGGSFVSLGARPDGYQGVDLAPALKGLSGAVTEPARVKPVWFHLPEGLVRAWYLEVDSAGPEGTDFYAYVISADDGSILFRHDLTQSDAAHTYGYRVYASPLSDPQNPGHPADGPEGDLFDPHPTGALDGTQPPGAVPQVDLAIQSSVYLSDPWLPAGAVGTTGNNVDAFSDLTTPDGFTANSLDARADLTGPQSFARTYDPAQPNAVNQLRSAVVQMFYNINFFHDWYYVSGFTEAAGNAQFNNYGRGGLQNDGITAEGQDFAGRNNANMATPADGSRPRMRMYLFDGIAARHLFMTGTAAADYPTGVPSGWGLASHDVTGEVVRVTDGVGSTAYPPATTTTATVYDGCDYTTPAGGGVDPNWAAVTGKVALIDRGGTFVAPALACGFVEKAVNAQKAGAIAVLIGSTTTHGAAAAVNMAASAVTTTPVTIPVYQLSSAHGDAIRAGLAAGPVTARLVRDPAVDHDGTVDNQIMAHEWGHYISNRLVGNSAGLTTNMAGGMGEGWADFHALLLTVKEEDLAVPSNAAFNGVYGLAVWTSIGGPNGPNLNQGTYFGIRRMPYSTDFARNNMTYKNIQDSSAVPVGVPFAFWPAPNTTAAAGGNSEVHNTGEVWASMLWECYAGILRDSVGPSPRLTFVQARDRMKDYLVAGYKATPGQPTFLEARDALLAAVFAGGDARDYQACLAGFARRGAGVGAVSPDRYSTTNNGVVESFSTGAQLTFVGATLTDDVTACDRDGVLDTGETGTVRISLRNDSAQSLGSTTASVAVTGAAAASFSLPAGSVVSFPPSLPNETVVGTLQVAMAAGVSSLTQLDLQITPADPLVSAQAPVTWSRRTNYDDVLGQSATDDVESGSPQFSSSTLGNVTPLSPWFRVENGPADHAYRVADQNGTTDLALLSPNLAVGVGPFSLSFRHRYSLEFSGTTYFDGAVVELTTDNGNSWTDIGSLATGQAYTAALAGGTPLGTRRAFAGANPGYPAYVTSTINLGTTYAGQTVRVRFRLATDSNGRADGWEVDDIAFTGLVTYPFPALLPNTCAASQGNRRPVASIGAITAQPERSTVTLTGTATDADLNPVTLQWSQLSGPPVTLTPGVGTVSFTAPDVPATGGSVVIVLTALDGVARSAAVSRTVPITNVDRAPTASAGSTLTVDEKTLVQLEGTAADPDGDALTVAWTQTAGPTASLSSAADLRPVFLAPEVPAAGATLSFQLAATAGGVTTTASVDVQVRNVNHAPGVDAGPLQTVAERSSVQLAGVGLDADGDPLTYAWTQVSPATPAIALSDPAIARPTFTAPEVTADTDFVLQLAVSDGIAPSSSASTVTIHVLNVNRKPVAVAAAGAPEVPSRGQGALDGRGSSDPDGTPLSYRWVQRAGPAVTLSDPTAAQPTFTAPTVSADTALTFSLEVTDGSLLSDPATVTVTVKRLNRKPLALAWAPTTVAERSGGVLDGLGSSDPDGDALTYHWTQVSPATPAVTLDSATSATPSFTAPEVGADTAFVFQLVVNDGADDSDPVQVTVNVSQVNRAPVAVTGADLTATSGDTVTLDASGSSDPDGDPRAYAWSQLSGPGVTLSSATAARPTFTAPTVTAQTVLGFSVKVSDGQGGSATSRMYVTVTPAGGGCSAGTGPALPGAAMLLGLLGLARRRRR